MQTISEVVGPCAILSDIEVLHQFVSRAKPQHSMVIQAIVSH